MSRMRKHSAIIFFVDPTRIRTGKGSEKREFFRGGSSEALKPQGVKAQRDSASSEIPPRVILTLLGFQVPKGHVLKKD